MHSKKDQFFPKISSTACLSKWTWSTVFLDRGVTSSCHRCLEVKLTPENFENFHNLPEKINERKIMQKGLWPTKENGGSGHCTYCKAMEDKNETSDRINWSKKANLVPNELIEDNTAVNVTPKLLEIYINNKCNLKCTYCGPWFSNSWEKELKKHGRMTWDNGSTIHKYELNNTPKNTKIFLPKILEWIKKHGNQLERLHLLGGETFYQPELKQVIECLRNNIKNRRLQVNIVSNFMVKENKFKETINEFEDLIRKKCIGRLDLTASIDGYGKEAEYARFGLDWKHFEKMFDFVLSKKWITLHINQTICALTVKSIPELILWLNNKRKIKKHIGHHFQKLNNRSYMMVDIFGSDFWKKDFEKIISYMTTNTKEEQMAKNYMLGVYRSIPKLPNQQEIKKLQFYLTELDKRRNTNWKEVFPYLDI